MLSILLLSEDRSDDAFPALKALSQKMLRLIAPQHGSSCVQFLPLSDRQAQQAAHGNLWKSRSERHRQQRIALMKTLVATVLAQDRIVVFHIDGDVPWSQREHSQNRAQFAHFLTEIAQKFEKPGHPGRSAAELQAALAQRLLLLTPHYSIEAWLYQNTTCAIALCDAQYRGKDRQAFIEWEQQREKLDEEDRPKDRYVLADRHNRKLAETAYPAASVYAIGRSFTDSVDRLRGCVPLVIALRPLAPSPRLA